MSHTNTTPVNRRTMLRAALGAAGIGAVAVPASAGARTSTHGLRVREQLLFVDRGNRQRFLWQSTKPPVFVQGREFPAEARGGPPDASYFIFNDEDKNEKGGLTASNTGAQISFDYPNVQAITLGTSFFEKAGASQLSMVEMPDPDIPVEELTREDVPIRVLLGTSNVGDGSLLFLYDHAGRPRITLQVDGDDIPRIQILDEAGGVVAQLPPEAPAAPAAAAKPKRSMLPFSALGRWLGS
jgi:hypothetical protein